MPDLSQLDAAMAAHAQHGAMACADPLTDSLFALLESPAAEGAMPQHAACSALTPAQRAALADAADDGPWLARLLAAGLVLGAAATALWPWGLAALGH